MAAQRVLRNYYQLNLLLIDRFQILDSIIVFKISKIITVLTLFTTTVEIYLKVYSALI